MDPVHVLDDWFVTIHFIYNYYYVSRARHISINYSQPMIKSINNHFLHPSVDKLYISIHHLKPNKVNPDTRRMQTRPKRFRAILGADKIILNELMIIDVMYIDKHPMQNAIEESNFSVARLLYNESMKHIWEAFLYWCVL